MTLTKAQRAGLDLILKHGFARYSNATSDTPEDPTIYWQTADKLCELGLAESVALADRPGSPNIVPTEAARRG